MFWHLTSSILERMNSEMMTGSPFNISGLSRKNIFWKFRQSRQEGGVVGEWGAESGKCATILCAHINAVRGNCARSHYEPSLTCEQWDHSASFASTRCLARKGQNKSRHVYIYNFIYTLHNLHNSQKLHTLHA